jgi:hypothetical protein
MRFLTMLLLTTLAFPLAAQTVVIGTQKVAPLTTTYPAAPFTYIDLSSVATADGTVTRGSIRWEDGPCTNAYKVKFFRPSSPLSARTVTLLGERGPFTAQRGTNIFPVNPPIAVKKGDYIGVTVLQQVATCGNIYSYAERNAETILLAGDVGSSALNGGTLRNRVLAIRATDTTEVLEGVIAGAGSLPGGFGSYFRTSVQITGQPGSTEMLAGRLVFRRAGAPASPGDPSITYNVTGAKAVFFADVVQNMGASGLGSIDVMSTSGTPPLVTARVYNDQGAAGTAGFTEDMIATDDALRAGETATLLAAADPANFRVNLGIRTLSAPVTMTVQYGSRPPVTLSYPANTFQQPALATLLPTPPEPNEVITFRITAGEVILYASTTDNRTNDSSIRFARLE